MPCLKNHVCGVKPVNEIQSEMILCIFKKDHLLGRIIQRVCEASQSRS